MAQLPSVTPFFGYVAGRITQDEARASVNIAREDGSDTGTLTGSYLVGCDGAHSSVRTQIGIERTIIALIINLSHCIIF